MQNFQYKILNRIINCNNNLCKWGIKGSAQCAFCGNIDTIQHHLYECHESLQLWKKIEEWIHDELMVKFNFTVCEIIFGIPLTGDPILEILNYIFMYAKHYINTKRSNNTKINFHEFVCILKGKVKILIQVEQSRNISGKAKVKQDLYELLSN